MVLVGIRQPVVGNPLPVEDSPQPGGDNLRPGGDNLRPEGGNIQPEGDNPLLGEGKRQTEVGKHQVEEGTPQAVVGSRLTEVGIQGSSFLEYEGEAGTKYVNNYDANTQCMWPPWSVNSIYSTYYGYWPKNNKTNNPARFIMKTTLYWLRCSENFINSMSPLKTEMKYSNGGSRQSLVFVKHASWIYAWNYI